MRFHDGTAQVNLLLNRAARSRPSESAITSSARETSYHCTFRGNDLVAISPKPEQPMYPMYLDRRISEKGVPMEMVSRFVTDRILPW